MTQFWVSNEVLGKAEKMPFAESAMSFRDVDAAQSMQSTVTYSKCLDKLGATMHKSRHTDEQGLFLDGVLTEEIS